MGEPKVLRTCGHPLANGGHCKHVLSDPQRPDCGRHRKTSFRPGAVGQPLTSTGDCRIIQDPPGCWRCQVHDSESWEAAESLGARRPCQAPLPFGQRRTLANDPKLDPHTAALLANDPSEVVRMVLVGNPVAPPEIVDRLAHDSATWVRYTIPHSNINAPAAALTRLAHDSDTWVQTVVGMHPNTPLSALLAIAESTVPHVLLGLAYNGKLPHEVWLKLAHHPSPIIRQAIADMPWTPPEILSELARDEEHVVWALVAQNENAPLSVRWAIREEIDVNYYVHQAQHRHAWLSTYSPLRGPTPTKKIVGTDDHGGW